jgi:glyceraldehyde 3-phosphate dehydrogenase (phosphorylating)
MAVRIGINGFGRIGRSILRLAYQDPKIEVVRINDISPPEIMAPLLKYDSVHGTLDAKVDASETAIRIDNRSIPWSKVSDPKQIEWKDDKVDVVLECTGKLKDRATCQHHLDQGCKKVIISAPFKECDVTIVMGVNQESYDSKKHHILSNASCTTNCLAPVAKILDENLTIRRGFMTTIHSYTNDQRILDGGHSDLRRARAGALNQIPTSTGGAKAIGLVLPRLKGKMDGMAIRVPTPNVSLIDLVAEVEKKASIEEVNQLFSRAASGKLKGILDFSNEPLVSSDYNGSKFSAVVDGLSTNIIDGTLIKVLAWYDNEIGFSQRMIDLSKFVLE